MISSHLSLVSGITRAHVARFTLPRNIGVCDHLGTEGDASDKINVYIIHQASGDFVKLESSLSASFLGDRLLCRFAARRRR